MALNLMFLKAYALLLSCLFAVRHLGAFAGIMVTASHNPAPFNGYKVYGSDGGQMLPADADALTDYIRAIDNPFAVALADLEEAKSTGLIEVIGETLDSAYLEEVKALISIKI